MKYMSGIVIHNNFIKLIIQDRRPFHQSWLHPVHILRSLCLCLQQLSLRAKKGWTLLVPCSQQWLHLAGNAWITRCYRGWWPLMSRRDARLILVVSVIQQQAFLPMSKIYPMHVDAECWLEGMKKAATTIALSSSFWVKLSNQKSQIYKHSEVW